MLRLAFLSLFVVSFTASAIVVRHDVDDAKYRVPATEFPALADLPGEAHGVLIAPQWVLTAAHATLGHPAEVTLNGISRKVERLIVHPSYEPLPNDLIAQAIQSGDASRAMAFQAANDDIALIKLSIPVTDVAPFLLYRGDREAGKIAEFIGKGAKGNGVIGQVGPNRTVLRRAYSKIVRTDGHWLVSRFRAGPSQVDWGCNVCRYATQSIQAKAASRLGSIQALGCEWSNVASHRNSKHRASSARSAKPTQARSI